jgi:hypothetical protein
MSSKSAKARLFVSVTSRRDKWYCRASISKGRVRGTMYRGAEVIRIFNVALRPDKTIRVDIGTGSGVKIVFKEKK